MSWRHQRIGLRMLVQIIGLAAFTQVLVQPIRAEVRISGRADAMVLEAREASVAELLAALRARFNLQFRVSGAVDRVTTGSYSGPLKHVIARLFADQNYVLRASAKGLELVVLGPGASGGNPFAWGHLGSADARPTDAPPIELPTPVPSPGAEGWNGMALVAPPPIANPKAPAAPPPKIAADVAPPALRPVMAAPAPAVPPGGTTPVKPSGTPALIPPQPEPVPQIGQSTVEGWGG